MSDMHIPIAFRTCQRHHDSLATDYRYNSVAISHHSYLLTTLDHSSIHLRLEQELPPIPNSGIQQTDSATIPELQMLAIQILEVLESYLAMLEHGMHYKEARDEIPSGMCAGHEDRIQNN